MYLCKFEGFFLCVRVGCRVGAGGELKEADGYLHFVALFCKVCVDELSYYLAGQFRSLLFIFFVQFLQQLKDTIRNAFRQTFLYKFDRLVRILVGGEESKSLFERDLLADPQFVGIIAEHAAFGFGVRSRRLQNRFGQGR